MRVCNICKLEKPLESYYLRYKAKPELGRAYKCIDCVRKHNKEYAEKHRERLSAYSKVRRHANMRRAFEYLLTHPCVDCGISNPVVLQFDHRNPAEKERGISALLSVSVAWATIQKEIDKCDVRCANCHQKRTAIQQNWLMWQWYHDH